MRKSKILSVVCARAGSKGVKNKCIKEIGKKMVIEYSIEYSLSLGDYVKTVVSTDIEDVITYCKENNISYIRRNPSLCTDEVKIDDALSDAIEWDNGKSRYCSLVYGNIPTRYPHLFHNAWEFLKNNNGFDAVISMQHVEKFHPDWMFDYDEKILPKKKAVHYRRQMLSQKMIHDGHTLLFRAKEFYQRCKRISDYDQRYMYAVFGRRIKPLINSDIIIDIDSEKDLKLAEAIIVTDKLSLNRP